MIGRVLCLTSNFPRWQGDSTTPFVLNLAEDLQAVGWQVDVLAPHAPGALSTEELRGVRVERFRYAVPESAETVCYQGGAMVNLRKRPLERTKLPMLVAAEWASTWRRLLSRKYDVLHSHWVLPQGFVGMLSSRWPRVPHVITLHGGDLFSLRGATMERLKRSALVRADAVTVNSSFTEAKTRALAPTLPRIDRIPMGVASQPLSETERALAEGLRQRYKVGAGPLMIFVGRLVDEKGGKDALRALSLLRPQSPDARLLILGEGQDRSALEALCRELGLTGACHFLGWVQPEEVRAHMAAADVFLGPSRTATDGWVEAQGLTFLEAMVVGTPVVASRLGGIVDSVKHEQTGLLVDERSPEQLAAAVMRLVRDSALRARMSEAGQRLAENQFSREESARRFAAVFERVRAGVTP